MRDNHLIGTLTLVVDIWTNLLTILADLINTRDAAILSPDLAPADLGPGLDPEPITFLVQDLTLVIDTIVLILIVAPIAIEKVDTCARNAIQGKMVEGGRADIHLPPPPITPRHALLHPKGPGQIHLTNL